MGDRRPGAWLAGLLLGAISGLSLLVLGVIGLVLVVLALVLVVWKGPRLLAGGGLVAGLGLVWTVLLARVALTCGGPLDPGTSTCVAGDLTAPIAVSVAILGAGLLVSAFALRRTGR